MNANVNPPPTLGALDLRSEGMYEPNFRPAVAAAPPSVRVQRPFWRRQFGGQATRAQRRFDVAFGLVLPVLCFVFDPIVFGSGFLGTEGVYAGWKFYAYTVSALEVVALAAWLSSSGGGGRPPAALGGVLLAGGLFSLVVGFAILPLSLLGLLFFLVGVFGFTPFPTALVYLRNGFRALRPEHANDGLSARDVAALVFGFVFALAAPALARLPALFN